MRVCVKPPYSARHFTSRERDNRDRFIMTTSSAPYWRNPEEFAMFYECSRGDGFSSYIALRVFLTREGPSLGVGHRQTWDMHALLTFLIFKKEN